jgi:16S rRNA (adenine1518-N6/adenine1519-N6)-dimethyltransferase
MDLTDITNIKKTLKAFGAKTQKDLGQHFLIDKKALDTIVETAEITNKDRVVEVGPGMGIMTRELCARAKEVVAVEIDPTMVPLIKTSCIKYSNLWIKNEDILKFDTKSLGDYKVVSNLPYYITSAVIRLFLESENKPDEMVLLIQKEVADRIAAKPNRMSKLSVAVQFYGNPKVVATVPRTSFFPAPKVDSAIIKIKVYKKPLFPDVDRKVFFRIVKAGFSEKRKQLINTISGGLQIEKEQAEALLKAAGINPQARAETLAMKDWYNLYQVFIKLT